MKLNPLKPNLNEIELSNGKAVLFSYKTPVAAYLDGKFFITNKKWSSTTTRHINQWLKIRLADGRTEEREQEFFDKLEAQA